MRLQHLNVQNSRENATFHFLHILLYLNKPHFVFTEVSWQSNFVQFVISYVKLCVKRWCWGKERNEKSKHITLNINWSRNSLKCNELAWPKLTYPQPGAKHNCSTIIHNLPVVFFTIAWDWMLVLHNFSHVIALTYVPCFC